MTPPFHKVPAHGLIHLSSLPAGSGKDSLFLSVIVIADSHDALVEAAEIGACLSQFRGEVLTNHCSLGSFLSSGDRKFGHISWVSRSVLRKR